MFILTNYKSDARIIEVDNVAQTTVIDDGGVDVTNRLIEAGILRGKNATSTGFIQAGVQSDLAAAVDSFGLFGVDAVVEACPQFDATTETERVGVSLSETRHERAGRDGLAEFLTYRIARFKTVDDTSAATSAENVGLLLELVDGLANLRITQADRLFVVDSISAEPIDPEQFMKNLLYCGVIEITLTSARGR